MIDYIVTMATHDHQWQLAPFAYMLRKYWGRDVQIVYYADRLEGDVPEGVEYRQAPIMQEKERWDWTRDFGKGFKSILRDLDEPVIAVCMMDMWLINPANLEMIDALAEYMIARPNVVRAALGVVEKVKQWSRCVETWHGMDIMTCDPKDNFHAGIMMNCGLFNRESTLSVYENTSSLQSEVMGWQVMQRHPELMSVWVRDAWGMYDYAHTQIATARGTAFLRDLSAEDKQAVKGLLPPHIKTED